LSVSQGKYSVILSVFENEFDISILIVIALAIVCVISGAVWSRYELNKKLKMYVSIATISNENFRPTYNPESQATTGAQKRKNFLKHFKDNLGTSFFADKKPIYSYLLLVMFFLLFIAVIALTNVFYKVASKTYHMIFFISKKLILYF
jgi:hypothetical protein